MENIEEAAKKFVPAGEENEMIAKLILILIVSNEPERLYGFYSLVHWFRKERRTQYTGERVG